MDVIQRREEREIKAIKKAQGEDHATGLMAHHQRAAQRLRERR